MSVHRLVRTRARGWLSSRAGLLVALAVLVYLLGFFLYQALSPVDDLLWQRTARFQLAEDCRLLVEYPARVHLSSPDEAGRPVTVRLWTAPGSGGAPTAVPSCSAGLPASPVAGYAVTIGPLGAGLEFTDASGRLVPAVVSPTLATSESAAGPVRLYVRQAPAAASRSTPLSIQAYALDAAGAPTALSVALDPSSVSGEGAAAPVVDLESAAQSRLRHLLRILFTAGPLQWLFTALGGLFGVWELVRSAQQKREERREKEIERRQATRTRIAALTGMEPGTAFSSYLALRAEAAGDEPVAEELRAAFQADWLPYLRRQVGRLLRAGLLDEAQASLDEMAWEWRQAESPALAAVRALIACLRQPRVELTRPTLQVVLEGLRAVGIGAARPIVRLLAASAPALDGSAADGGEQVAALLEDVFFVQGGAGGRYLLRCWAEQDARLSSCVQAWERRSLPVSAGRGSGDGLWPRSRGESRTMEAAVAALGLDFNPFGPEKAEQDPRLPDLFYRLVPVWEEMVAARPSLLLAPPGSGRTAIIWMARYECGLAGSALERVFPVWVPVYACANTQELAGQVQRSVAAALCTALARDPYALLGLDGVEQQGVAALLFQALGGLLPVRQHLRRAGLRADDPDGRLLDETLGLMDKPATPGVLEWEAMSYCPYGADHVYLLVDVACPDQSSIDTLLECLLDRWLPAFGPRHLVPKVLLAAAPKSGPAALPVKWDRPDLAALLRCRLERAGLVLGPDRPLLDGWVDGLDLEAALLDGAAGSPARLIRLGNRVLKEFAGRPSLPAESIK